MTLGLRELAGSDTARFVGHCWRGLGVLVATAAVLAVGAQRLWGAPAAGREASFVSVPPLAAVVGLPERLEDKIAAPELRHLGGHEARLARAIRAEPSRCRRLGRAAREAARPPSALSSRRIPRPRSATGDSPDPLLESLARPGRDVWR